MKSKFLLVFLFTLQLYAQEEIGQSLTIKKPAKSLVKDNGWHPKLDLGSNLSIGSSKNVIGQLDGDSKAYGVSLLTEMNYRKDLHELQTSLQYTGATSSTPALPRFVKSNDELKLKTLYIYSFDSQPRIGPYIRAEARAAVFLGEDVRAEDQTYLITDQSGNLESKSNISTLRLTDGFKPLTTTEAAGMFFYWIEKDNLLLTSRLGLGAQQVEASGQFALADDEDTPEIEVSELPSYSQLGFEGGLTLNAKFDEKTSLSLNFDFLTPIDPELETGDNRSDFDMTNIEFTVKLSSKLYDWLSVKYEYLLREQPQLLDETQTTHFFGLNFDYSVF